MSFVIFNYTTKRVRDLPWFCSGMFNYVTTTTNFACMYRRKLYICCFSCCCCSFCCYWAIVLRKFSRYFARNLVLLMSVIVLSLLNLVDVLSTKRIYVKFVWRISICESSYMYDNLIGLPSEPTKVIPVSIF